jgi:glycosyl transferase family 4
MKILITGADFSHLTGSPMYMHDLAIGLTKNGHDVTILSQCGGEITASARKHNVRCIDYSSIFSIQDEKFDVIHYNQSYYSDVALAYFKAPCVQTLHSELSIEQPIPKLDAYISVRDTVADKYKELNSIVITNGVDLERFNTKNESKLNELKEKSGIKNKITLFIGNYDFLRKKVIDRIATESQETWLVGLNPTQQVPGESIPKNVKVLRPTFFVEKWIEMADEVVGIQKGRTMYEAWACGKDYIDFQVNDSGDILSTEVIHAPKDMTPYSIEVMVEKTEKVYKSILK